MHMHDVYLYVIGLVLFLLLIVAIYILYRWIESRLPIYSTVNSERAISGAQSAASIASAQSTSNRVLVLNAVDTSTIGIKKSISTDI
jgi:beta-lactamase regulating signal transducer with metallopeptidase domain